jgi:hypothetical protein
MRLAYHGVGHDRGRILEEIADRAEIRQRVLCPSRYGDILNPPP